MEPYSSIIKGDVEAAKKLQHLGKDCATLIINRAARNGHLEMVKWIYGNGFVHTGNAMYESVSNGQLEIVKWLHTRETRGAVENREERCSNTFSIYLAISNGHLKVVKWLYDNTIEETRKCVTSAIKWVDSKGPSNAVESLKEHVIKKVYYRAWLPSKGKKILWNLRLKRKFYINQSIRARPPYGVDYLRDLDLASEIY